MSVGLSGEVPWSRRRCPARQAMVLHFADKGAAVLPDDNAVVELTVTDQTQSRNRS